MKKSVGVIPKYVSASGVKELRRAMLRTQLSLGYGVNFFNIQYIEKQKKWFAWYEDNIAISSHNVSSELNDDGGDN